MIGGGVTVSEPITHQAHNVAQERASADESIGVPGHAVRGGPRPFRWVEDGHILGRWQLALCGL